MRVYGSKADFSHGVHLQSFDPKAVKKVYRSNKSDSKGKRKKFAFSHAATHDRDPCKENNQSKYRMIHGKKNVNFIVNQDTNKGTLTKT